jgi:hypothetical protein
MRPSQALDHERGGGGTSEALVQRRTVAPTPHWGGAVQSFARYCRARGKHDVYR